ncbi:MAG: dTDP-4-dehydrorhamnose 3,5-epimerase [Pricia sp.]
MTAVETELKGCFIIEPRLFEDERGHFYESYNEKTFNSAIGQKIKFVQDNQSHSRFGVVRALHYQIGNAAQAKLVRVTKGKVLDVAVDLREGSPTFGQYFSIELSEENKKQLFIPRGFAHGFSVLSETADFLYKCDNYYNKEAERGIIYNDATLKINWQVDDSEAVISDKDAVLPSFAKVYGR